jgi:hypothetical protein
MGVELTGPNGERLIVSSDEQTAAWAKRGYVAASSGGSSLEAMTKAELIDEATRRGVDVAASWTKAEIIDALT